MRSPEVEPSRPEVHIERDWCLRSLTNQVVGRNIDTQSDQYLIEQVNASHDETTSDGYVMRCRTGDCEATCVLVNKKGILEKVSESGTCLFE